MKKIKYERIISEGKEKKDKRKGKDKNRIDKDQNLYLLLLKRLTFILANSPISFLSS